MLLTNKIAHYQRVIMIYCITITTSNNRFIYSQMRPIKNPAQHADGQ